MTLGCLATRLAGAPRVALPSRPSAGPGMRAQAVTPTSLRTLWHVAPPPGPSRRPPRPACGWPSTFAAPPMRSTSRSRWRPRRASCGRTSPRSRAGAWSPPSATTPPAPPCTDPFDTSTAAGRMLVQMLGVFAEFEREMIIDRVVNGMERKAAKGKWTLGTAPFGYTVDPAEHVLIPNEDEAPTVKEIFHLYTSQRLGTRAIATRLNERGLSKRGGRPWSHKIVAHVLVNRVYLGEIAFRGIVRADAHHALVDSATFELAERILTDRGENPASKAGAASDYHLTGKLTCPRCGRTYLGTSAVGRSRVYRYYTCFTRSRYGVDHCAAPRIDADALETAVLAALADFYTTKLDQARQAVTAARAEHRHAQAGYERELAAVTEQLAAKEAVVDTYLTDYEEKKIDRDIVARRIDKISEQIRRIRHRRDELLFLLDSESDEPDGAHLTRLRDRVTQIITTGTTPERKALCDALIAELRLNGTATATPVFRVPLTGEDTLAILGTTTRTTEKTVVRERPPTVRRQGLEPRTRGLRAATSALLASFPVSRTSAELW